MFPTSMMKTKETLSTAQKFIQVCVHNIMIRVQCIYSNHLYTVEPNNGHIWIDHFVHYREAVL